MSALGNFEDFGPFVDLLFGNLLDFGFFGAFVDLGTFLLKTDSVDGIAVKTGFSVGSLLDFGALLDLGFLLDLGTLLDFGSELLLVLLGFLVDWDTS